MRHETYIDGILWERRDDTTRIVSTYGPTGQVTNTRPYTTAEDAAADARAAAATSWALLTIARALTATTKETP